jgi:hypothetical protein
VPPRSMYSNILGGFTPPTCDQGNKALEMKCHPFGKGYTGF